MNLRKIICSVVKHEIQSIYVKKVDEWMIRDLVLSLVNGKEVIDELEVDKIAAEVAMIFGIPKVDIEKLVMEILRESGKKIN